MNRRRFIESAVAATALAGLTSHARGPAAAPLTAVKPKRLSSRRHGRHRRPGERDLQHAGPADRPGIARGARSQGRGRRGTCWTAMAISPGRTRTAPPTSTASSPIRTFARCCRCAAAGARAACCRRSTTTRSAAIRRSCSATATSPRCTWRLPRRPGSSRSTAPTAWADGTSSPSTGSGACSSTQRR